MESPEQLATTAMTPHHTLNIRACHLETKRKASACVHIHFMSKNKWSSVSIDLASTLNPVNQGPFAPPLLPRHLTIPRSPQVAIRGWKATLVGRQTRLFADRLMARPPFQMDIGTIDPLLHLFEGKATRQGRPARNAIRKWLPAVCLCHCM